MMSNSVSLPDPSLPFQTSPMRPDDVFCFGFLGKKYRESDAGLMETVEICKLFRMTVDCKGKTSGFTASSLCRSGHSPSRRVVKPSQEVAQ